MNKKEWSQFLNWLEDSSNELSKMTVGDAAVHVSDMRRELKTLEVLCTKHFPKHLFIEIPVL